MQDPLRNGVLFCELICYVENIQLFDVCYSPKVIKEWRDNIDKFVVCVQQVDKLRDCIPPSLLSNKELILKGDHATVWGLLNWFRKLYPDVLPRTNLAYLENSLPYTNKELIALEASLLNWIHSCGAVKNVSKRPTSLLEIEDELKNGTIYCRLVQFIFNTKLNGVFAEPKTEATKISNLRKATDVLKREKSMSQKYTWTEREIARGNRECMIGLLEDMHILFDGYPPRQAGRYFENGPHIGRVFDQISRKQFYYRQREDASELDQSVATKPNLKKDEVRDFIGEAKTKFISDLNTARNDSRDLTEIVSDRDYSDIKYAHNNIWCTKSIFTERHNRKHENVPSIINNQTGKDVCSPIAKVRDKQYLIEVSPQRKEQIDPNIDLAKARDEYNSHLNSEMKSLDNVNFAKYHNNQASSKPVSEIYSPESYTFLPHKRITEESMDYTEKSRSEELEELQDIKQEAHKNYTNHK